MQKPAKVCKSMHKYSKAYSKQKQISKSKCDDNFFLPFFKFYDNFFLPFFKFYDDFFPPFFKFFDDFFPPFFKFGTTFRK